MQALGAPPANTLDEVLAHDAEARRLAGLRTHAALA